MANTKAAFEQQIQALVAGKQWLVLSRSLEDYELTAANETGNPRPYYSLQLLTYLILNDLDSARFLWKRIPTKYKKEDAELPLVWAIGKAAWQKNNAEVYKAATALHSKDALHQTLVISFVEAFRERQVALLAKSFSNVRVETVAEFLGLSVADATTQLAKWEQKDRLFTPSQPEKKDVQTVSPTNLQSLTQYVVFLEKK